MTCKDCFHRDVCTYSSNYTDVNLCKQFVDISTVQTGQRVQDLLEYNEKLLKRNDQLKVKIAACEAENRDLESELSLLRIIKQTLEMASGMTFAI